MTQDLQDKVSKLQKVVTASEQDRIVLSERLEAAKGAITELKKQLGTQGEKVSGLNRVNEDSELRRLELETQIKTNKQVSVFFQSHWDFFLKF